MASDVLKDLLLVLLGLGVASGIVQDRAEHTIRYDLSRTLHGGKLRASVRSSGMFGLLFGQSSLTEIEGRGFQTEELPFRVVPDAGLRVHVRRLRVDFRNVSLRSLPVERFTAEFPAVSIDPIHALFDERIVLRSAGEGRAEAVVETEALRLYIARRFPQMKTVEVCLIPGAAQIRAEMAILGAIPRVEIRSKIAPVEGRYLFLEEPNIQINGQNASPLFVQSLLRTLNPLFDLERDLGLGRFVYVTEVEIGAGRAVLRGRATIPRAERSLEKRP